MACSTVKLEFYLGLLTQSPVDFELSQLLPLTLVMHVRNKFFSFSCQLASKIDSENNLLSQLYVCVYKTFLHLHMLLSAD